MSLRVRTLLSLAAVCLALLVGLALALRLVVLRGFEDYEAIETGHDLQRATGAIEAAVAGLREVARDWAGSEEARALVQGGSGAALNAGLAAAMLTSSRLSLVVFLDGSGRIVASQAHDFVKRLPLPFPPDLVPHLAPGKLARGGAPGEAGMAGLLRLGRGRTILVAVEPIVDRDRGGPARGTLLVGRYLDRPAVQGLAWSALSTLIVHDVADPALPADVREALVAAGGHSSTIRRLGAQTIAGYVRLDDVYGQPALVLEVRQAREAYAQARVTMLEAMLVLLAVSAVFAILIVLVLERGVLSRISALSAGIDRIGRSGDATARLPGIGSVGDELGRLAESVNGMLRALETAQAEREATRAGFGDLAARLQQGQTQEAIGRFSAGLARDFDSLVTIVLGRLAFVLSQLSPGDPLRQHIELIRRLAERLAALTHQLGHRQPGRPEWVDLGALVARMEPELRALVGPAVTLRLVREPRLGLVEGDTVQLEQVLRNLLANARDAMPEGGVVTVKTANVELGEEFVRAHHGARAGRHVMLEVTDTGTGIDEETRARLFEPFYTTKEMGKGAGLGLATVYGVVKEGRGYVGVESAPGRGAMFTIYLPSMAPLEPEAEGPAPPPAP